MKTGSMFQIKPLKYFNFWCQKVLPLVYDDSLSYYEVLCKVVSYLNNMVKSENEIIEDVGQLKEELDAVQEWINNYDTDVIEEIIRDYLATMIFVEITDTGYFVYYIPDSWADITFNTTDLDITIEGYEYGRLVLSY